MPEAVPNHLSQQRARYMVISSPDDNVLVLYARCCVVANGRDFYESVLSDPAEFPNDTDFEALLELASAAHELKFGKVPDPFDTPVSYETFSNQAGWAAA